MNRFGAQLRKLRLAQNLTQEQLAEAADTSRVTIQNRERGTYRPDFDQRARYAAALGVSLANLNLVIDGKLSAEECLARERHPGQQQTDLIRSAGDRNQVSLLGERPYPKHLVASSQEDTTKRRDAITGALALATEAVVGMPALASAVQRDRAAMGVLAALRLPPVLHETFASEHCPLSTAGQVEAIRQACDRYFSTQDATLGGTAAYIVARALHHQTERWLQGGGQPPHVTAAVHTLHAELATWAGWLAYDAGQLRIAHRYLQDAIVHARLIDHPAAEVRAMVHLCLLLNKQGKPAQALQTAQAALRIANTQAPSTQAPPQLSAILMQRAASSHAYLGQKCAFVRASDAARNRLEAKLSTQEGTWQWVTSRELIGLTGRGHAALGEHDQAQAAYRQILDDPDPRFPRNNLYYQVQLAKSLIESGDIGQGASLLSTLLPSTLALDSGRIDREVHHLRSALATHPRVPQARDFIDAFDQAML